MFFNIAEVLPIPRPMVTLFQKSPVKNPSGGPIFKNALVFFHFSFPFKMQPYSPSTVQEYVPHVPLRVQTNGCTEHCRNFIYFLIFFLAWDTHDAPASTRRAYFCERSEFRMYPGIYFFKIPNFITLESRATRTRICMETRNVQWQKNCKQF